ncbi:lysophospholipid acyltransferase 5-like [Panonychus citri]|uniref:lysophospholipid acyltransferase 5-like n=1 Tax=Panonychus citri TaxID=50023 RepID=UPI002307A623|nr:lysophospholipid acyltransferase 5-like [Panonychus citri]XP_053214403.1 lysophospholipid acyltransferase 5-like [Panonychus citri]
MDIDHHQQSSSFSPIVYIATFGANVVAVKILFSLLSGYPLAIIYNCLIVNRSEVIKKLFFSGTGLALGLFNYGYDFFHTTITIFTMYFVLKWFGGTKFSVTFAFLFNLGYLLAGYFITQIKSNEYSFEWTIPQCVLTLRLIAIAFDLYDGKRIAAKVIVDGEPIKNETPITEAPEILELFACCYLPFSFMVGPQFEYKKFQQFLKEKDNVLPACASQASIKLGLGLLYLICFLAGEKYFPPSLLLSDYYKTSGFFMSFTLITLTTKIQTCKYIGIWLLAEGSLIMSGFTFVKSNSTFRSYCNADPYLFETSPNFTGLIKAFNITTNQWSGKYVFKRLKFLGNRIISHAATLMFLAVWHGWKSGYYVTFGMEFLIMKMEWEVMAIIKNLRQSNKSLDNLLNQSYIRLPILIFLHIYTVYMFGYCLASFTLLTYKRWVPVLKHVYFSGHLFYISWILISPWVHKMVLPERRSSSRSSISSSSSSSLSSTSTTSLPSSLSQSKPSEITNNLPTQQLLSDESKTNLINQICIIYYNYYNNNYITLLISLSSLLSHPLHTYIQCKTGDN